jgi:hypothetical protein
MGVMGVEIQTGGLCGRTNARLGVMPYGETFAGRVEEWACYREISRGEEERCGPRCLKSACLHNCDRPEGKRTTEARGPPLGSPSPNNNEHRAPQTALGSSFPTCTAGWYVYSFMFGVDTCHAIPIVVSTTKDEINTGLARATNPVECVGRLVGI